jgi:hypothetical protein
MSILNLRNVARVAVALACALPVPTALFAQGASPFAQLAGNWHGSGTVRLSDGKSERLSCRGTYAQKSGGAELSLAIRCQSENNKIEMKSALTDEGGRLSGRWSERNFGLEGELNGRSGANKLSLQISGQLQGSMTLAVNGSSHRVTISTVGPGFKSVSIDFSRG